MSTAYDDGRELDAYVAAQRAEGNNVDVRLDLVAAAAEGRKYFADFRRGLESALLETST